MSAKDTIYEVALELERFAADRLKEEYKGIIREMVDKLRDVAKTIKDYD